MKILIGYDGSEYADAALDDLKAAGLRADVEAHVISVAEVWLPPPPEGSTLDEYTGQLQSQEQPFKSWQTHAAEVERAGDLAKSAASRLRSIFPSWKVTSEGTYGSSGWEIVEAARRRDVDLIVVGSQGRSAIGRFFLGSISQKVLTEAECSVRVARGKIDVDPGPVRIVVAYDGTDGANAAVEQVASRGWPDGSEIRLVSVTDLPYALTVDTAPFAAEKLTEDREWLSGLAAEAAKTLRRSGLAVETVAADGNPKSVLVDYAEDWRANCIFLGANRFGGPVERFLLGSVSAAVAARAGCSVEAVRRKTSHS
jgi:nucleotide-binding universal stress UspA family protein